MSELLLGWLNDEVQLSRRISNFEEDFNNGFLLGELLFKYNQQLNFNEFIDKEEFKKCRDDKATRVNNFTLLFDTFKTLGVNIDANIALGIMEKKTGLAKKTICELKMQLEKTTSNAFSKLSKPNKPLSPLKKVPIPKEKFDKIAKEHFNNQLNEIHKAQKNINLESHLNKFSDFQQKQVEKAEVDEKKEAQAKILLQKKFREKQLDNIKKSSDFRNDWEQSNLEKWATNIATRKLQQDKDNMFKTKLETTKFQNKTMSELSAIKVLDRDLKEFEKRTLKRQDDSDESEEEKSIIQSGALIKKPSTRQFLQNSTKNLESKLFTTGLGYEEPRKKVTPQEVETYRHQREKRRRKMIVEQSKKQQLIKIDRMDRYIISTLSQNSKQEKEIEYEIWRAWQNKEIILQNKESEIEKIKEKEELKTINLKFKNEELLKTYKEEHEKELYDGIERQNKLKTQNSVKKRKNIYEECKNIIQEFISITEIMYEYNQEKNQNEPDPTFITHLLDQFVENLKEKKEIAEYELTNYIHAKGEWKINIKTDNEEQPTDPTLENALPISVINNYYLGNILKTVFTNLYETKEEKQIQNLENEYLVSLLGLEFSGKKIIAEKIKEKFGFNIIIIENLIQEKIKDFEEFKNKGLEIDGETAELIETCYNGKKIPNHIIINLIKQNVQKHPKSIIVNYPTTYEECIEFTKTFGNSSPSDHIPKSQLEAKIEEFSRLVWPTETKIFARSLRPCGIDFAIWLDISPKVSLDRFLGRRWTPEGNCIHINDENIGDPNNLIVHEKASALILKNDFKLKNREKIEEWLNQFGVELTYENKEYIQKCWEIIPGEGTEEEIENKIFKLISHGLEIKNKQYLKNEQEEKIKISENEKFKKIIQFEEQLKNKCTFTHPENIITKFNAALESVKMQNSFLIKIENLWNQVQKLTINGLTNVFQALREQEEQKNKYISNTKRNFIQMLTREDERFYLVKTFQNEYNKFFDNNNDMIVHDYTKEELHQRVEDLETDLLTLIEEKKEDVTSERENIIKSGWLESQFDQIITSAHILLQIELNRSFSCQQIITDFYSKKYLVNTGEIQETSLELNVDSELEVIKEDKFPRLDKLLSEALRLFNKEEEIVEDKNKKGGKPPPKKEDKKQPPKKGVKEEPEEKVEPTKEELEFKKAINTEKSIFRYRVKIIYQFICKKLKKLEEEGTKLYEALEDYLKYTDEVENKAVIEMTKIFKKQIEEETKIEYEVQIHYTQIIETEKIRNFKRPKPVILPIAEKIENNRFMTSSIKEMVKNIHNGNENVQNVNK